MAENQIVNATQHPENNHQIVNTIQHPENNHQNIAGEVNHKAAQPVSEKNEKSSKKQKKEKKKAAKDSKEKKQSKKSEKKLFKSCAGCCKRKKAKLAKSRTNFANYVKKKSKKCRSKRTRNKQSDVKDPLPEDVLVEEIEDSSNAIGKDGEEIYEKRDSLDLPVSDPAMIQSDQISKLSLNQLLVGMDPQDFTKSCCFLCAKNAMAIAAAISAGKEKSDVCIQTSVRYKGSFTVDKGCSPMMYVRTVQSSVKVRTRDMGTLHPEKKKKKPKTKLNFKKFNIIPKMKFPGYPKVRTVACETEKSMGHNNIPQCRARRGGHCAIENR